MYIQRKCKYCGQVFSTKRYPNQFCSQSCYFKHKRAERNAAKVKAIKEANPDANPVIQDGYIRYSHTCSCCGKRFLSVRPSASFCSKSCYRRNVKGLKSDSANTAKAEMDRERAEYYNERYRGRPMKFLKTCPVCGKEFAASKVTTIFCSSGCAKKYRTSQDHDLRRKRVNEDMIQRELNSAKREYGDMMRIDEVASYLGVSRSSVKRYVARGIISCVRMPGVTLIQKSGLDDLFRESRVFRNPRSKRDRVMPEVEHSPVLERSDDYISIAEAAEAYGLPLNVTQNFLRRSDLEFVRFRNVRFYNREDVDKLMRARQRARHPEITEWYTVDDIMSIYAMDRKSVYNFVYSKDIPKKKDGLKAKYSKSHVDDLLSGGALLKENYYTAEQIEEKYAFDRRRLYKLISRIGISKRNVSGRLYVDRSEFDSFMLLNGASEDDPV